MPTHHKLITYVKFIRAGDDTRSPSKFVDAARALDGVQDAYRINGRYDAVVIIHSSDPSPGENEKVLREIQKIPNVAATATLTGYPTGHTTSKPSIATPGASVTVRTRP